MAIRAVENFNAEFELDEKVRNKIVEVHDVSHLAPLKLAAIDYRKVECVRC